MRSEKKKIVCKKRAEGIKHLRNQGTLKSNKKSRKRKNSSALAFQGHQTINGLSKKKMVLNPKHFREVQSILIKKNNLVNYIEREKAKKNKGKRSFTGESWYRENKKTDSNGSGISFGEKSFKNTEDISGMMSVDTHFANHQFNYTPHQVLRSKVSGVDSIHQLVPTHLSEHLTQRKKCKLNELSKQRVKSNRHPILKRSDAKAVLQKKNASLESLNSNIRANEKYQSETNNGTLSIKPKRIIDNPGFTNIRPLSNSLLQISKSLCPTGGEGKFVFEITSDPENPHAESITITKGNQNSLYTLNDSESMFSPKVNKELMLSKDEQAFNRQECSTIIHMEDHSQEWKGQEIRILGEGLDERRTQGNLLQNNHKSLGNNSPYIQNRPSPQLSKKYLKKESPKFYKHQKHLSHYQPSSGISYSMTHINEHKTSPTSFSNYISKNKTKRHSQKEDTCPNGLKMVMKRRLTNPNVMELNASQEGNHFHLQSKTSIENPCLRGQKKPMFPILQQKKPLDFKSLKKEKPDFKNQLNRSSSSAVENPFGPSIPDRLLPIQQSQKDILMTRQRNPNVFGNIKEIYSENSESHLTISKYLKGGRVTKSNLLRGNFYQQKSLRISKAESTIGCNPKSLKESVAFMTPDISGLKVNDMNMSFNCFSNADVSLDALGSANDNEAISHSNSNLFIFVIPLIIIKSF